MVGSSREKCLITRFFSRHLVCGAIDWPIYFFVSIGPGREKRLITRLFGSYRSGCGKLADLFLEFFGFILSEVRQNSRIIFHLHDCFGSRQAPRNLILFREKRLITRLRGSFCKRCERWADFLFICSNGRSELGECLINRVFRFVYSKVRRSTRLLVPNCFGGVRKKSVWWFWIRKFFMSWLVFVER